MNEEERLFQFEEREFSDQRREDNFLNLERRNLGGEQEFLKGL